MDTADTTFFEESKPVTSRAAFVLLGILVLVLGYGAFTQLYLGKSFGNGMVSGKMLGLFALLVFGLLLFYKMQRLNIRVSNYGIYVSLKPFGENELPFADMAFIEVITLPKLRYGIRYNRVFGKVYSAKANTGLLIKMQSGHSFLIATDRAEELELKITARYPKLKA
ncbi:MAG: hypothetical protein ACXITV_11455 [Luteibaculaceae bacterium]